MKFRPYILFGASLIAFSATSPAARPQAKSQVAASGTTVVRANLPRGKVTVEIRTVKLEGACARVYPGGREWMGLGFKQITAVSDMTISVNRHRLSVPPSSYATLFAPHAASLQSDGRHFALKIKGADGAYSYISVIYFDASRVDTEKVYSGMDRTHPIAVTNYYTITVGP